MPAALVLLYPLQLAVDLVNGFLSGYPPCCVWDYSWGRFKDGYRPKPWGPREQAEWERQFAAGLWVGYHRCLRCVATGRRVRRVGRVGRGRLPEIFH